MCQNSIAFKKKKNFIRGKIFGHCGNDTTTDFLRYFLHFSHFTVYIVIFIIKVY